MKTTRFCTVVLVMVVAGLGLSPPSMGGPFGWFKFENVMLYIQGATHLLIAPDPPPGHPIVPFGQFWTTPFTLAAAPAAAVNGSSQHIVAPHPWDPPVGPLHVYGLVAPPPPGRAVVWARMWHSPNVCPDVFLEVMGRNAVAAVYAAIGRHDPPPGCPGLHSMATGREEVPPTPGDAIAASAFNIMLADNTFILSVVVNGIAREQLIGSAIHLGPPGVVGPPIYDLGPGSQWMDLEGTGIARSAEGVFPAEYVDALLAGETYVNLCTMSYPEGEIRGQLVIAYERGDLNCDGLINFADINPFVLALSGQAGYEAAYPNCNWLNADCSGDGTVNFADINPFVALLGGGR